jgi:glycosyltransferase involved in cell wall biosynthesis
MGLMGGRPSGGSVATRRVAVYGEVDPNLVDGSSVWLLSVCQVLASRPDVHVTLLLRRPLDEDRRFLLDELRADPRVDVVDSGRPGLLAALAALEELARLDRERGPFDLVVLRGQDVLVAAARSGDFAGRRWPYVMAGRGMLAEDLSRLSAGSARLLCQTDAAAAELRRLAPEVGDKILVLPPMIPDAGTPPGPARAGRGPLRLAYSGKLAPEYCWLETVDAFRRLRAVEPAAELHVFGDKVHRPPGQPEFHSRAMRTLAETGGLHWHGALPRSAVGDELAALDLALSIRDPGVEAAWEISTKVLEYGAAGLPVVLNRAPVYEDLLGADYPLFIEGPEDAAELLVEVGRDPDARAAAAAASHAASREFTFTEVGKRLAPYLAAPVAPHSNGGARASTPRVLIAGHDLKFTDPVRETIVAAGAEVAEDVWANHTEHNEGVSRAALEEADTIFCEWCLGNAGWYSRNKRPSQRLVIRLHRVEVETDYPAAVEIDNVDKVVFVSQHIADEAVRRFGWDEEKLVVIPNAIDVERFALPKEDGAQHTLAMVGYVPKRKRLDLALDIVEGLRQHDLSYRLLLIGHPPSELRWVASDPAEAAFFRECFKRVQETDELRGAVAFQPFTEDLPQIFRQVGFVVSTSDSEGHQVALAEGAASGAVPVVLDRPGAAEQYRQQWVLQDPAEAVSWVTSFNRRGFEEQQALAAAHARSWSSAVVSSKWHSVLGINRKVVK